MDSIAHNEHKTRAEKRVLKWTDLVFWNKKCFELIIKLKTYSMIFWIIYSKPNQAPFSFEGSHLCQLLCFVVKWINHFAHVMNGFQGCLVGLVHWRLIKYDKNPFTLVQNTYKCKGQINVKEHWPQTSSFQRCIPSRYTSLVWWMDPERICIAKRTCWVYHEISHPESFVIVSSPHPPVYDNDNDK